MESSSFPWDQLPVELQETILSLLPISTLVSCTAASGSLRSLIQSQDFFSSYRHNYQNYPQPLFLFFDGHFSVHDAYDPLLDRWTSPYIPLGSSPVNISASAGPLLLTTGRGYLAVSNPFDALNAPTIIKIPQSVPRVLCFYPIAVIPDPTTPRLHFKIVTVSTIRGWLISTVYDSIVRNWKPKEVLHRTFALIGNGVIFDDGLLYCLGRDADRLLRLDHIRGGWEVLDVDLPAGRCLHLLAFDGKLLLVGGMEDVGALVGIGIWEMHWRRMEWRDYCFMPQDAFVEFSEGGINNFETVDRKGMICFVSNKRLAGASILMCDLSTNRWWRPRACKRRNFQIRSCVVRAVEPYIDLVMGSVDNLEVAEQCNRT